MCILLYRQTHVDIFFVDWEKPRMGNDGPHPISVWRRLFVANEWNERSNLRISSLTASLLLTLMALVGFGYLYAAKPEVGCVAVATALTTYVSNHIFDTLHTQTYICGQKYTRIHIYTHIYVC